MAEIPLSEKFKDELAEILTELRDGALSYGKRLAHHPDTAIGDRRSSRDSAYKKIMRIIRKEEIRKNRKNKGLNKQKWEAHEKIDCVWRSGAIAREQLYKRLGKFFKRPNYHISDATAEECELIMITDWLSKEFD